MHPIIILIFFLQGPPDSVLMVMDFITEKIMEKPDPTAKPAIDFDNKICAEREKQIKVIVPNSTAGMIIGKGRSLKKIRDYKNSSSPRRQKHLIPGGGARDDSPPKQERTSPYPSRIASLKSIGTIID